MTVAILGAGWIGLPLGRVLAEAGHTVHAATTTPAKLFDLRESGLAPFLLVVTPAGLDGDDARYFFEADALVLTLPPGRGDAEAVRQYPQRIELALRHARRAGVAHVVYTSSTSVYPDLEGAPVLTETDAGHPSDARLRASGRACLRAERLVQDAAQAVSSPAATVVRLAGLYGPGRSPTRYLAGRTGLTGGDKPVNLVHRDDVVAAIRRVLDERIAGTFNLVADEHPTRRDYHTAAARALGFVPPVFAPDSSPVVGKRVSNARAKDVLGLTFRPLDPRRQAEDTAA
ncbi:MAG: SDR family oxidoreductase [Bacteroidota bacterium]